MGDAEQFRRDAVRYRKLAAEESNPVVARRMLDFAVQYEALADLMEETDRPVAAPPSGQMQHQPVQQQQSKIEPEDEG